MANHPRRILPAIVLSQFAGTSLWFATNAILPEIEHAWQLGASALSLTTSALQAGFIAGTLAFAVSLLSDRVSPRVLFFVCSILGALFNSLIVLAPPGLASLVLLRFATGVCLAGIYPVGMKIASGWYREGLGLALGYLVGALVVGTAFPHLLRWFGAALPWQWIVVAVSAVASLGGFLMLVLVPDGPFLASGTPFTPKAALILFRSKELRAIALGYFGHMWELYSLYAFLPLWLAMYVEIHPDESFSIPLWTFLSIAAGGAGCAAGGLIARSIGSFRVASIALFSSGICCVISPFVVQMPIGVFLTFVVLWGIVVVADSPQFSTLVALAAPRDLVGSVLTLMVSIGFAITIVSIEVVAAVSRSIDPVHIFLILAPGPLVGLTVFLPVLRWHRTREA